MKNKKKVSRGWLIYGIVMSAISAFLIGYSAINYVEGEMLAAQNREYKNLINDLEMKGVLPYEN